MDDHSFLTSPQMKRPINVRPRQPKTAPLCILSRNSDGLGPRFSMSVINNTKQKCQGINYSGEKADAYDASYFESCALECARFQISTANQFKMTESELRNLTRHRHAPKFFLKYEMRNVIEEIELTDECPVEKNWGTTDWLVWKRGEDQRWMFWC